MKGVITVGLIIFICFLLVSIIITCENLDMIRRANLKDVPSIAFLYTVWMIILVVIILFLAIVIMALFELFHMCFKV